jgi:hypothetical protein
LLTRTPSCWTTSLIDRVPLGISGSMAALLRIVLSSRSRTGYTAHDADRIAVVIDGRIAGSLAI